MKRPGLEKIFAYISSQKNMFEIGNYIYEDVMIGEVMYWNQIKTQNEDFTKAFLRDSDESFNTRI